MIMGRPQWLASLTQHGSKPPYMLKFRSSEGFIIGTVALAVFTDMFLYGVIVPVVPFAIQTRSHVEESRVQYWVSVLVAIYGAALLVFSPICGWIADRNSSRRSTLLIGLLALLGATALLNIASSTGLLIAGRILQGSSAAVVWVVGLALLADTVPQHRIAQSMGYVSLGMSLGILVAPLLGGVVFDYAGYNAVFGMCYALIGVDIILRILLVEKKVAARWASQSTEINSTAVESPAQDQNDVERTAKLLNRPQGEKNLATTAAESDHNTSNASAQGQSQTIVPEIYSPSVPERHRRRDRLPPILSLLYSRRLLSALFCSIIQAALLTSFDSVLTIHAAKSFGWSSTGAGLLFLALVIPSFLAPLFGWMSDRYGGRYPASIGFVCACPPLVCLRFINSNTLSDKVLLCALLALIGLFLSLTFPPIMAEISSVVEAKEKSMIEKGGKGFGPGGAYAQAYALFNVAFAAGCMFGPLLAGFVVQENGWATMAWVLGLLSAITAFPAFLWLGGWL